VTLKQHALDDGRVEEAYEGVRVSLESRMANARIPLQIDVGFGDVIKGRWFKSSLRNHKLLCLNKFRISCNHPN